MNDEQLLRYARHLLLEDFGFDAQTLLMQRRVLIVGMGGLGSPVAMYLAAAGVGHLVIADHDKVELSNLQRQIIHQTNSLGKAKVESAKGTLFALNPEVDVQTIHQKLDDSIAKQWLSSVDLVIDCSDNYQTRQLVNRYCVQYQVPLVSAAAITWNAMLSSFDASDPQSPCYACLFDPEQEPLPLDHCATMGVISPLLGVVGSMQALEALKILTGKGSVLQGKLAMFDGKTSMWRYLGVVKNPHCRVCASLIGDEKSPL